MYETCLRSRFIVKYSELDPELPGRYLYYTNSKYHKLCHLFVPDDDRHANENEWAEYHKVHEKRYSTSGEGDYGWAYPHIKKQDGSPSKRPGFGQLMKTMDPDSKYSGTYYKVFVSKGHGGIDLEPPGYSPCRSGHTDRFVQRGGPRPNTQPCFATFSRAFGENERNMLLSGPRYSDGCHDNCYNGNRQIH